MGILNKILGKEKTEIKKESKKANDDANRERMRTPSPAKTSIVDKIRSQKEHTKISTENGKAQIIFGLTRLK